VQGFDFDYGDQHIDSMIMHPGYISAAPVPAALWLFGRDMPGLIAVA